MITVLLPLSDYPVILFNLGCVSNEMIYVNGPDKGSHCTSIYVMYADPWNKVEIEEFSKKVVSCLDIDMLSWYWRNNKDEPLRNEKKKISQFLHWL